MSLAVLARKTKAKQRVRTRGGFILNMTGRGNVLGLSAKMSRGNCKGLTNCAGKRAACCAGTPAPECCTFKHGGKPAPQMGYGVYLNRKSKGAYRSGGGPQCCTEPNATAGKIVYKQPANISASEIIQNKKESTLACYHETNDNSSLGSAHCSSEGCTGNSTYIALEKYKMHVGSDGTEYGYDNVGALTFGNLCPGTLMGFRINSMEFEDIVGGYQFELSIQTNGVNNPTQCSIQSITFFDPTDNSVKKYYTKNVTEFDGDGAIVRWRWGGGSPQDYWAGKLHKCLQVTIEVEKTKDITKPCDVKKCFCRGTDLVRYVRINHQRCSTTKTLPFNVTAGEQIVRKRSHNMCPKYNISDFKKPQMLGSCNGR